MSVPKKPTKASLRRWLIALAIAALLLGGLWALWSAGSASASASNDIGPSSHPASNGAGHAPFVSIRRNHSTHAYSLHMAGNADGLRHLPDLGANWEVGGGEGVRFSPPEKLPFLNTLAEGDDGFSFPFGGNWSGPSNQGVGLGTSGPGGPPSAEDSSHSPSTPDGPQPDPTDGRGPNNGDLTSAVPEPATWAMMLIGFAAIGFAIRREKKLNLRSKDQFQY